VRIPISYPNLLRYPMNNQKLPSWLTKPSFLWTAAAFILLVGLPWLIVTVVRSDAGMAACFLLFYAIDPVFAIAAGMFAGKDPRRLWFLPILTPLLFLAGTWLCFDPGEPAFVTYALMYLLLGGTTMFVFLIMTNGRRK